MPKHKKVVIFDFDGTLADTAMIIRDVYDGLAKQRGWPKMDLAAYRQLRQGSLNDARKWAGIHLWQLPFLMQTGRKLMHEQAEKVSLFPGITPLVQELKEQGFDLYVLSRNSSKTVKHVLERYELEADVSVLPRALFRSKSIAINRLIFEKRYNRKHMFMVGDETRDVDAGNIAGIKTIAVTWGLQDEELLIQRSPTFVAKTPSDIAKILGKYKV